MRTLLESKGQAKSNLNKVQVPRTTVLGERLMINISSIKAKSYGSSKYWLLIIDDCSDEAWSRFLKKKSETTEQVVALIKDMKEKRGNGKIYSMRQRRREQIARERVPSTRTWHHF
jgi:hypothetical protein